jgi:hypothetical protein
MTTEELGTLQHEAKILLDRISPEGRHHHAYRVIRDAERQLIEFVPKMLDHIDAQTKQIEILKAALIEARIYKIGNDATLQGRPMDLLETEKMARQQLSKELPEIDWNDR